MAFYAIAPLLCMLGQNEIQMTLYIHQAWGGAAQNEVKVVEGFNNTRWGEIRVQDFPVRDRPDLGGEVIGRAQGIQMKTNQIQNPRRWYTSMTLEFTGSSRLSGSTLQMIGFNNGPQNEWSIVGGTGQFIMARGVAKYTSDISADSDIMKVDILAYYPSIDSTVYTKSGCNSKIREPIAQKTIS